MPEVTGRLRTPRLSSAPASPVVGELYYDVPTNKLRWWNGTTWIEASGGGAGPAQAPLNKLWLPPGVIAETYPRQWSGTTASVSLGTLRLSPITVPANSQIRRAMMVANTAANAPTNNWCCLIRPSDLAVLTKSNNKGTEAWAANAAKIFDGLNYDTGSVEEALYFGFLVTGTGAPQTPAMAGHIGLGAVAPMTSANSTTGLTTPASLGATAAALVATAPVQWVGLMTA